MKNPSFALGALHFGSLLTKQESETLLLRAIDLGIDLVDTAPLYGRGESESIIGDILAKTKVKIKIATKVGLEIAPRRDQRFGVQSIRLNLKNIQKSVATSLKKLKTDSIDLLNLHAYDKETPLEESVEALSTLYKKGWIRSFGCSNYNPTQLKALLKLSNTSSTPPFVAAQCHYNMIEQRASKAFTGICEKNGIIVVVNRALGRGALSGKYTEGAPLPENSRAHSSMRIRKWLNSERLGLIASLASLARENEISLTTMSLAWILRSCPKSLILIGARDVHQLEECFKSKKKGLNDTLYKNIELLIRPHAHVFSSPPRYFEK